MFNYFNYIYEGTSFSCHVNQYFAAVFDMANVYVIIRINL